MKRLPKKKKSVKRSWLRLGLKKLRLLATTSLQMSCLALELRHRRKLARRQVKRHMRLPRTTPYFKRYSIPIMKMYRSSARRVLRLKARLSAHELRDLLRLRGEVRSLFHLTTTAHTQVVGRRQKVRGLICRTSSGVLSYAKLSKRRAVTRSWYATCRKLNRESSHTSQTTKPYSTSLLRVRMLTQLSVPKCLASPVSIRKTTPIYGSRLNLRY